MTFQSVAGWNSLNSVFDFRKDQGMTQKVDRPKSSQACQMRKWKSVLEQKKPANVMPVLVSPVSESILGAFLRIGDFL